MEERPKVTQKEFEQIRCNHCGACCERLWLPSPETLDTFANASLAVTHPSVAWIEENRRFVSWVLALEPTGKVDEAAPDGNTHQYRCKRFVRLEDGLGFCTAYDDRPNTCRRFPYGQPVADEDFEACSFNVEIVPTSRLGRALRWLAAQARPGSPSR